MSQPGAKEKKVSGLQLRLIQNRVGRTIQAWFKRYSLPAGRTLVNRCKKPGYWDDPRPYGGSRPSRNWAGLADGKNKPDALVEELTNAIDARLIARRTSPGEMEN